jgi:AcrR family transcriptional regulator
MTVNELAARHYRGAAPDERRALRRGQLIAAALAVYGERGYRQATVKAVCEAAGLTERYFYESFSNSEALLVACYASVTGALNTLLGQAGSDDGRSPTARARAMLQAYLQALQREPRAARVFLLEIRGVSAEVDAVFEASLLDFGRGLAQILAPAGSVPDPLLQTGVVGGVMHIAVRWIADGYQPPLEQATETALRLCQVLGSAGSGAAR